MFWQVWFCIQTAIRMFICKKKFRLFNTIIKALLGLVYASLKLYDLNMHKKIRCLIESLMPWSIYFLLPGSYMREGMQRKSQDDQYCHLCLGRIGFCIVTAIHVLICKKQLNCSTLSLMPCRIGFCIMKTIRVLICKIKNALFSRVINDLVNLFLPSGQQRVCRYLKKCQDNQYIQQ